MRLFRRFRARRKDRRCFGGLLRVIYSVQPAELLFQDTEIQVHQLLTLLQGRQPLTLTVPALQRTDRDIVRSSEVRFHLLLKIGE